MSAVLYWNRWTVVILLALSSACMDPIQRAKLPEGVSFVPPGTECPMEGANQVCYSGNPATLGVGECITGVQVCQNGAWTPCTGEMLPVSEYCDGLDNNCDGQVDEGVLSACGDCTVGCKIAEVGHGSGTPFHLIEGQYSNLLPTDNGGLTLEPTAVSMSVIWVANSVGNTVSKLDTLTGHELGRYRVCKNPSRTAVGQYGDGWVACRDDGQVARIINFEGACTDKNGNGVIDTARDTNGNHTIDADEILDIGTDECVAWMTDIAGTVGGTNVRAMGVGLDGTGWAGVYHEQKLIQIDPSDGSVLQTVDIPDSPYGLVIDMQGIIWVSGRDARQLVRVDPGTGNVQVLTPAGYQHSDTFEPYGIALDEFGRVWVASCCTGNRVWMYDPNTNIWQSIEVHSRPRGIVSGHNGRIFVANDESHEIAVIDSHNMHTVGYVPLGASRFPIGMALDAQGHIWSVNEHSATVHKMHRDTLEIVGEYSVGAGPYCYSDMTGTAFFDTVPPGWYRHRFYQPGKQGITGLKAKIPVRWQGLIADFSGPAGSYVKIRLRSANSEVTLDSQAWSPFFGPYPSEEFPLELESVLGTSGIFLDVEVWLYPGDHQAAMPVLNGIYLQYNNS